MGFSVFSAKGRFDWSRTTDLPNNGRLLFLLSYSHPLNDVAKWEQIKNEEERNKYQTLEGQRNSGGGAVVDVDELLLVLEV